MKIEINVCLGYDQMKYIVFCNIFSLRQTRKVRAHVTDLVKSLF